MSRTAQRERRRHLPDGSQAFRSQGQDAGMSLNGRPDNFYVADRLVFRRMHDGEDTGRLVRIGRIVRYTF